MSDIKILYVEDEFIIRRNISEILENKYGKSNVISAENGIEALELFKNNKFDILITDIKMSPMNGVELITNVRNLNSEIPIIVVSAYEKMSIKLDISLISEYLVKPISKFTLLYTIEQSLNE